MKFERVDSNNFRATEVNRPELYALLEGQRRGVVHDGFKPEQIPEVAKSISILSGEIAKLENDEEVSSCRFSLGNSNLPRFYDIVDSYQDDLVTIFSFTPPHQIAEAIHHRDQVQKGAESIIKAFMA